MVLLLNNVRRTGIVMDTVMDTSIDTSTNTSTNTIVDTVVSSILSSVCRNGMLLPVMSRFTQSVVPEVKTQIASINVSVTPKEEESEDRLGNQIKDAVKDSLRIRMNHISALGNAPGDGIKEPDEDGENTTHVVGAADGTSKGTGMATAFEEEAPDDVEESCAAEDEVTPLVSG